MERLESLHAAIHILAIAADILLPIMIAVSIYLASRDKQLRKDDPLRKRSKLPVLLTAGSLLLVLSLNFSYFAIAVQKYSASEKRIWELPAFPVTSENLHGGMWDPVISNTEQGENKSPQLSWEPVSGADAYAIVMVDEDARYWMHWKTASVTSTELPLGYAPASEYVGPYPPSGQTHTYTIYVVALKVPRDGMVGMLDAPNDTADHDLTRSLSSLDTDGNGRTGNAIAMGTISGTFTSQ